MHRCFRDGTFAIGLILGISLTLIFIIWSLSGLGWMWLDDPKPYSYTYTEKKCAEQKIGYGADIAIILKGQNAKTATSATESTNASKQWNPEQPDWCDLASQESMAKSTYWMNKAAWAGIILSVVGVWLIWRTLAASRQTLREAGKATKAAFKTVEVTREIGEAQTRAYLSIREIPDWNIATNFIPESIADAVAGDEVLFYQLPYYIENSGNSPATNVMAEISVSIFYQDYETRKVDSETHSIGSVIGTVGKGLVLRSTGSFDAFRNAAKAKHTVIVDKTSVWINVKLIYSDIFDNTVRYVSEDGFRMHAFSNRSFVKESSDYKG